jgi:hypothetical protein
MISPKYDHIMASLLLWRGWVMLICLKQNKQRNK